MKHDTTLDSILKPIAGFFLLVPAVGALIAFSAMWRGYVLSVLWAWFIVPTFGAPELSIPFAIGLALVVGFLTASNAKGKEFDWLNAIGQLVFGPAMALLMGWIVTKFI